MAERTLPESLSGEEIRLAIIDKLMTRMAKDCYLSKDHAYEHFSYKISVHVELLDLGRIEKVDVSESDTVVSAQDENAALDQFDAEISGQQEDPNTMRVETGQPVPVLSHDSEGKPDIKRVRYSRKAVAKR